MPKETASAAAASDKKSSDKRKETLALRKKAEEAASKAMGKPVKLIVKKPKAKKSASGETPRKYIAKATLSFNKKTGDFTIIPKKPKTDGEGAKKKTKAATATSTTSSDK